MARQNARPFIPTCLVRPVTQFCFPFVGGDSAGHLIRRLKLSPFVVFQIGTSRVFAAEASQMGGVALFLNGRQEHREKPTQNILSCFKSDFSQILRLAFASGLIRWVMELRTILQAALEGWFSYLGSRHRGCGRFPKSARWASMETTGIQKDRGLDNLTNALVPGGLPISYPA